MRIRSLILIVAVAGMATLAGCTSNRTPADVARHGATIESTDPNVVRYAPLVVYIAPGETPPHGTMKFKPAEDK